MLTANITAAPPTIGMSALLSAAAAATIDGTDVNACLNALSSYFDTPLAVDGLAGIHRQCDDPAPSNLTHLIFYDKQSNAQAASNLIIHLIRNGRELMVFDAVIPKDRNLLFRAAATAALAARYWNNETVAASDADTHMFRKTIAREMRFETHKLNCLADVCLLAIANRIEDGPALPASVSGAAPPPTESASRGVKRHFPG